MQVLRILKFLDDNMIDVFTVRMLSKEFGMDSRSLHYFLEVLVSNEIIYKLEGGKYCRSGYQDEKYIGCVLTPDAVISHDSAFRYYGLSTNTSNNMYLSTSYQKKDLNLNGIRYKFIQLRKDKLFGYREINDRGQTCRITDLEKTIIDGFNLPGYIESYDVLSDSLRHKEVNKTKLLSYALRLDNISLLKRISFISEYLGLSGYGRFQNATLSKINKRYTALMPGLPDEGPFNGKWKIRVNMPQFRDAFQANSNLRNT